MSFLPVVSAITSSGYFVPISSAITGGVVILGLKKVNDLANDAKRYFLAFASTATTYCLSAQVMEWNNCDPSSTDWSCETMKVVNIAVVGFGAGCCVVLTGKAAWDAIRHHPGFIERSSAASAQCINRSMTSIGGAKKSN